MRAGLRVHLRVCVGFVCIICKCLCERRVDSRMCLCVAGWHGAKVNRGLVSVLNAFLDLTGHVQA